MSVAAHHNDWLNLVEVSGPFLALPVLMDALPAGLDKPERELTADLWRAFTEWSDEDHGGASDPTVHEAWVRYVLEHVLEFDTDVLVREGNALDTWAVEVPEHDTRLTPDLVIRDPEDEEGTARLLVTVVAPDVSVTEPPETGWTASPAERMESLLKEAEARLGIVTNGDQWTLVHIAEGENTGFTTWYASLWREEPLTLRAFITLLGMRRFFAVAENETLDALLDRSREDQQGVTTQLGKQVRRAIEILIQQIDRVDHDRDGRLLEGMTEERLYESAVTVMMRLIFLFYAEENDLLLLGDDFYDQNYAASTLREQLQATADESGEEILERFHDAWPRLLSTFRAVHTGVEHEQMRLPAYGGALFDPDRYPFLEGRAPETTWLDETADPLPIDNRTVLHLLNSIQTLEVKVPGGGRENRPLSFRALDVEQIGHVYETLLDHTAVRAEDWIFGLEGTKDKEPEVPLGELEARADDQEELVKYLKDETGRSAGALKKRVAAEDKAVYDRWGQRWTPAFQGDEGIARRATRWGLLVREDSAEHPVVVPPGRVYVTESERRRSSGTHYTPRSLTEEIVTHALEPLVYDGPAESKDRSDWELRSPGEILDLKVCDPACGSGAFLVQACRYLAERLVEAWNEHNASDGPDGYALPSEPEERLIVARRYVADRCLYGVDINPLATEMAKLSLWLITLQKNRPFTFLDHAVRTGDSLLGVTDFETLESFGVSKGQTQLWSQSWAPQLKAAKAARDELRSFAVMDEKDVHHKRVLLDRASRAVRELCLVADAVTGLTVAAAAGLSRTEIARESTTLGSTIGHALAEGDAFDSQLVARIAEFVNLDLPPGDVDRKPFHWVLEFPEVALKGRTGFDALVGNPPFLGGLRISGAMGSAYRAYLVENVAGGQSGAADYVAYFFLRALLLLAPQRSLGFLATTTIAQGDTRHVGLEQLSEHWEIRRATREADWPGEAQLSISKVWYWSGKWQGDRHLDGTEVGRIGPDLYPEIAGGWIPQSLKENSGEIFIGTYVYGSGFILDDDERRRLLSDDPRSVSVLRPYLNGADVNRSPQSRATRWVIDFGEMSLDEARRFPGAFGRVEQLVYPERQKSKDASRRERWWQFTRRAPSLYSAIADKNLNRVIVRALTGRHHAFALVDSAQVIDQTCPAIVSDSLALVALLQSSIHMHWWLRWGATLGQSPRYVISDVYDTFPKPILDVRLDELGEQYLSIRDDLHSEVGLTSIYNRVNDASCNDDAIRSLRNATVEIDDWLVESYNLTFSVTHAFIDTSSGIRFGLTKQSEVAVLDALVRINRDRYKAG